MLKSILVSSWRKILPSCFWTICTENPFNRLRSDVCLILRRLWCSVLLGHNGILAMNPHFVLVLSFALHQMLNLLQRGHKDDLGEIWKKKKMHNAHPDNAHLSQSLMGKKKQNKKLLFPISPLVDLFVTRCCFGDRPGTQLKRTCLYELFTSRLPGCKSASFLVRTIRHLWSHKVWT